MIESFPGTVIHNDLDHSVVGVRVEYNIDGRVGTITTYGTGTDEQREYVEHYIKKLRAEAEGKAREREGYWKGFRQGAVSALMVASSLVVLMTWALSRQAHSDEVLQPQLAWPQLKQSDLPQECQLYPNAPCLVPAGKETEQQREQREYQERQLRLQMDNAKKVPKQ